MTSSHFTVALLVFGFLVGIILACIELVLLKRTFHILKKWRWILLIAIINFTFVFFCAIFWGAYIAFYLVFLPLLIGYTAIKIFIYNKLKPNKTNQLLHFLFSLFLCILSPYYIYGWVKKINPTIENLKTAIREKKNGQLNVMLWLSIKEEPAVTHLVNESLFHQNGEALYLLFKQGANPRGEYWLRQTSEELRWVVIKWMLEQGVKPAEINTLQSASIEYIATSYTVKELAYCIQKGFDPKVYSNVIHAALEQQSLKNLTVISTEETLSLIDKVKLLLNHGADINGNDFLHFKPIFTVMGFDLDMSPVLKFILENGANANARTVNKLNQGNENELPEGMTPLMLAVYSNNLKYVELLLRYGADKTLKDSLGHTAHDYVNKGKTNEEIMKKLY
jgi:ankyrin repeat protein